LELTGLAKPSQTHGLTGLGTGLAHQVPPGRVFGQFWNQIEPLFRLKPGLLLGYPDPLLILLFITLTVDTLLRTTVYCHMVGCYWGV
jgi:hypothetical protein